MPDVFSGAKLEALIAEYNKVMSAASGPGFRSYFDCAHRMAHEVQMSLSPLARHLLASEA